MKRIALAIMTLVIVYAAAQLGCMDRQPAPVCPVPTELKTDQMQVGGFDGVDLLVMVDDSISMTQEQQILSTSFFPLVNSLANPIYTEFPETNWPYPPAEELRLAVVTSNMGFSSNGDENDEYYPGDIPPSCVGKGDNGVFQTSMPASVNIATGIIPCDASAAQCPAGWTCDAIGATTGVGTCASATTSVNCPAASAVYIETTDEAPNPDFPIQAACLAQQGTGGCGFEQQLASVARALTRSDEEDCSMKDGKGLFEQPEVADLSSMKINIACGENGDPDDGFLFAPGDFYQTFIDAKGGMNGVVFAAIAGVPYTGDQADACQGPGDTIGSCNDQDDMQLVPEQPEGTTWYYRPACTRTVGATEVTRAYPGRRYVELANGNFGNMGYVYSICNADWSPAMTDIARLIASQMTGTCYKKPLDWDPVNKVAKCNVVVEYTNPEDEECPSAYGDVEPIIKKETTPEGEERTLVYCPIPKLPSEQDCAEQTDEQLAAIADEFGWYYCETMGFENFAEACSDGIDNDGDGDIDCDDADCADCLPCPGALGNNCAQTCKYKVELTETAKSAVAGMNVSVQCLQQFSFEDRNCQEDTRAACTDSLDNDGNGIWDCANEAADSTDAADEKGHQADPSCCPMVMGNEGRCDLEPTGVSEYYGDICPSSEVSYTGDYPDACWLAAQRLGCTLP
jgi:hypothetical protein